MSQMMIVRERSVRWNPFHLIVTCNLVLIPLEGTWNHVHVMCPSMWVCWCRLRNICKLCMQMNLTKEPLIHISPVICKLDIEKSFDWVCNFMNGILSQGLFTIAYIYKC